jgi:type IV secretory pathway ATPase VirB11/archaellum biosynthesis ATPase
LHVGRNTRHRPDRIILGELRGGEARTLLGIRNMEELLGHPVVGPSWEGMLIENILGALPATARTSFYRTSAGAEIDLVIEFSAKERWAIEIKRSLGSPAPSKGRRRSVMAGFEQ